MSVKNRSNISTSCSLPPPEAIRLPDPDHEGGAEELGGDGDMLLKEADRTTQLQGFYVDSDEIRELITQYR